MRRFGFEGWFWLFGRGGTPPPPGGGFPFLGEAVLKWGCFIGVILYGKGSSWNPSTAWRRSPSPRGEALGDGKGFAFRLPCRAAGGRALC